MADQILTREICLAVLEPKLKAACEGDPKWNQLFDEENSKGEEHNRLEEEVTKLDERIRNAESDKEREKLVQQKKITELKKDLAHSKSVVAVCQRRQRQNELEMSQLEGDLKAATSHQERERIQHRLKKVDGEVQEIKRWVHHYEEQANREGEELKQLDPTIKEEESQQLLDEALKQGYLLMRFMIALIMGPPGVGKTCLKHLLLGKHPPHPCERCSTICAEHPVQIRSVSSTKIQAMLGKWREVSPEQLLPSIGRFIRRNASKHGVALPNELKEYLEQLEASDATPVSESVASSSPLAAGSDAVTAESTTSLPSSDGSQSSTSQDEAAALKVTIDSVFAILQKVIAGEELSEAEFEELFSSDWVYVTDCGGQTQFQELLPLFIQEITSLIVVSRLSDRLDECPPDEYYQQGELVGKTSATHLSAAEQVKCLTRSMMSCMTEGSYPDVIMVGTHRDRVSECSESIEQKNEKLLEMFGPELEEHLVFFRGVKDLFFPLNTINPEEQDRKVAGSMQEAIENSKLVKEVKVPIWWFILEILMQGLAKKLGKRVLKRELCVSIAHALGFTERAFEAALKFFNKLNVMKYSSALPDVVFVDSQVPLDNISDLVWEGYLLRHGSASSRRGNWKRFCYEGVVTLEFMASTCKHFEKGIFESRQLLELLKERLVVVPLKPLSDTCLPTETDEYFMPALLDILSREELEKLRVFSSAAAPLLFRFSHGCRRAGVFCCLAVYLMKESKWSIQHENGGLILVARNCIKFRLPESYCVITLIDAFYYIEVHMEPDAELSLCREVCPEVRRHILAGIDAACTKLRYTEDHPQLAVLCPVCSSTSGSVNRHAATVLKNGSSCVCTVTSRRSKLVEGHTVWLAEQTQATTVAVRSIGHDEPSHSALQLPVSTLLTALPTTGHLSATGHSTTQHPTSSVFPSESSVTPKESGANLSSELAPLHLLTRPQSTSTAQITSSATHLPHIPEYISISSGAAEELYDMSKPNSTNLTVIRWKNKAGEVKRFRLKSSIIHKWRDIGNLVLPRQQLEVWAKRKDDKECCEAVLSHWLDHSPRRYPATWEGLYDLLEDSELGEIAGELRQAVDNAV